MDQPLRGVVVAIPEYREQPLLQRMLEEYGAVVLCCPMVAINDHPDQAAVQLWLEQLCAGDMDLIVLYTGEGLRRLVAAAERLGLLEATLQAMARIPLVTRGPKPVRALREVGLKPAFQAATPTTEGVMATLATLALDGKAVGVQLYGDEVNAPLMTFLASHGAKPLPVFPYRYAPAAETEAVAALVEDLIAGRIHVLALTSAAQWQRLKQVAGSRLPALAEAHRARRFLVAAVGPVLAEALAADGFTADAVPQDNFFMKPLVRAIERLVKASAPG
jgi:uroporphyrinogen-III synthase